jgi:hypothetical protein
MARQKARSANASESDPKIVPLLEPERCPRWLLRRRASVRLDWFEHHCIVDHERLLDVRDAVLHYICAPGNDPNYRRKAKMVLVLGPPRVGKSTMIELVLEELAKRAKKRMKENPGYVPYVYITLESTSHFDWKSYYVAILQALNDPFLERWQSASERVLREVVENALRHRQVEVIFVDEAQHLAKAARGSRQQDQLDQLKYFENKLGVTHVLVGTYDMRPFRRVNAQLACRTVDVHFRRYDATVEQDLVLFTSAVRAFQCQLPVTVEPRLWEEHAEFLYARSLGCIGLLKQILDEALALALDEKADTVTEDHLKHAAHAVLAKDKLDLELKAILLGEEDFARAEPTNADEALLISLGIHAPPPPPMKQQALPQQAETEKQEPPAPSKPKQKKYPGERNPGRDKIGIPEEEQEQADSDTSGVSAGGVG